MICEGAFHLNAPFIIPVSKALFSSTLQIDESSYNKMLVIHLSVMCRNETEEETA